MANYNATVLKNCEDAELSGGFDPALRAQNVQEALDDMRTNRSTTGVQFW